MLGRLFAVLLLLGCAPVAAADRPHVYLVVVDGLDTRFVTPEAMPVLFASGPPQTIRATMPARTNPSHVSLLTGTYPDAHGITGNAWWNRVAGDPPRKTDVAALIEAPTLFTTAEALVTLAVFGKPKLGRLFAAVPDRQRAADVMWTPAPDDPGVDPVTRYAQDATTMDAFLRFAAEREPDLAAINLSEVDRTAHGAGPEDPQRVRAVGGANTALQRLVDALRAQGRWDRSIVFVTADHGFDAVPQPPIDLAKLLDDAGIAGVVAVADGGVSHLYAATDQPDTAALARAAALVRRTDGVAEVLARIPVPDVPLLADVHPDWHLDHPRTGDVLAVASPGFQFAAADEVKLRGNHGSPRELRIPLAVLGGHPATRDVVVDETSSLADLGATVAALLGLRPPAPVRGTAGRSLLGQSPH